MYSLAQKALDYKIDRPSTPAWKEQLLSSMFDDFFSTTESSDTLMAGFFLVPITLLGLLAGMYVLQGTYDRAIVTIVFAMVLVLLFLSMCLNANAVDERRLWKYSL